MNLVNLVNLLINFNKTRLFSNNEQVHELIVQLSSHKLVRKLLFIY